MINQTTQEQINTLISGRAPSCYFVEQKTAKLIAEKIVPYIEKKEHYSAYIDLCYGSGNLSLHLLDKLGFLDNDGNKLEDKVIIFNDKNKIIANGEISEFIVTSLQNYDVFTPEFTKYLNDDKFDLIIANFLISATANEAVGSIVFNDDKTSKLKSILTAYLADGGVFILFANDNDIGTVFNDWYIAKIHVNGMSKQINLITKQELPFLSGKYNNENIFTEPQEILATEQSYKSIDLLDSFAKMKNQAEQLANHLQVGFNHPNVSDNSFELPSQPIINIFFAENFEYKNIPNGMTQVPLNLILKGVPGTGKSRLINKIINNILKINDASRVLRVNIHSASSNADLMQGIGIATTKENNIQYLEKTGLILRHIENAIKRPDQDFVLVLEEIQENKLNELIGDLIYLIEKDKRTDITDILEKNKTHSFDNLTELVDELIKINRGKIPKVNYVDIPYLIDGKTESRKLIFPANLYVFCTSNYRDDKKIIEDNLLRRFTLLELYPKYAFGDNQFADSNVLEWLEKLNERIIFVMGENHETHPDRFMIGHAIFKGIHDKSKFAESLLKIVTEFKDIREIDFKIVKEILESSELPPIPLNISLNLSNYKALIDDLQNQAGFNNLFDENNYQSSDETDPDNYENDEKHIEQNGSSQSSNRNKDQQQWRTFYSNTKDLINNNKINIPERWKTKISTEDMDNLSTSEFITCAVKRGSGISSTILIKDDGVLYGLKKSGQQGSQYEESKWLANSKERIEEKFKIFANDKYKVNIETNYVWISFPAITNPEQLWEEIYSIEPVILELVEEYESSTKSNTNK